MVDADNSKQNESRLSSEQRRSEVSRLLKLFFEEESNLQTISDSVMVD